MSENLQYLLTSDFKNLNPTDYINALLEFRNEYRILSGKNTSLGRDIEKLSLELQNKHDKITEINNSYLLKIAELENEMNLIKSKLNKKLSLKERVLGKILWKKNI